LRYNPDLVGYATGVTLPLTHGKDLDAAVSMAKIADLPSQIDYLVSTMQGQYKGVIDFENDWKLVTLLIGANDICTGCGNPNTPTQFAANFKALLTQLKASIPRVFVNVMSLFNISGVYKVGESSLYCKELERHITFNECPCMVDHGDQGRKQMDVLVQQFNQAINSISAQFASNVTGDTQFTVSVQPAFTGLPLDKIGLQFLSTLDCFHPSLLADEYMAVSLFINMQQAPGNKTTKWPLNKPPTIPCPTQDTLIQ